VLKSYEVTGEECGEHTLTDILCCILLIVLLHHLLRCEGMNESVNEGRNE